MGSYIFVSWKISTIPYNWIFPRCSVVIHHGGRWWIFFSCFSIYYFFPPLEERYFVDVLTYFAVVHLFCDLYMPGRDVWTVDQLLQHYMLEPPRLLPDKYVNALSCFISIFLGMSTFHGILKQPIVWHLAVVDNYTEYSRWFKSILYYLFMYFIAHWQEWVLQDKP